MPRNQSLGLFPSSGYKNFTMNDLALSQRMTYSKENELDTIKEYLSLFSELSLTEFIEELYSNCNAEQRLTYEIFKDEITIDGIVLFFEEQIYIIKKVASKIVKLAKEKKVKTSKIRTKLSKIIRIMFSTVHQYFKNDLDDQLMIMRKAFVLYFGILYCKSSNIDKTLLFFQLFSQYQGKIQDSYSFEENSSGYVLQLCYNIDTFIKILCFFCGPAIGECVKTREEQYKEITQLRPCQQANRLFNRQLFGSSNKDIIDVDKCISLFQMNGLGWIFNPSSIRAILSVFKNDTSVNELLQNKI